MAAIGRAKVRGVALLPCVGLASALGLAHCGAFDSSVAGAPDASAEGAADAPQVDGAVAADASADGGDASGPPCVIVDGGAHGVVDTTYQNGLHFTGAQSFAVRGGTIDAQGRVHVVGFAGGCAGNGLDLAAVRLTPDGALDTGYGGTTKPRACVDFGNDDVAWGAAVDQKGRLVIAGVARKAAASATVTVVRLTEAGQLDATFNAVGTPGKLSFLPPQNTADRYAAFGVAVDGNDIVVVGGNNDLENSPAAPSEGFVVRLTEAGALDPSFVARLDNDVVGYWAAAPVGGGRLLVAGTLRVFPPSYGVRLLERDGSLVKSFGVDGTASATVTGGDVRATDVGVAADGTIFVSGTNDGKATTARFDGNGKLDRAFATSGVHVETSMASNYAFHRPLRVQCDGKVILGGDVPAQQPRLMRLTAGGAPDPAFGSGGTLELVNDAGFVGLGVVLTDPRDGKILFVGGQPGDPGPWVYRVLP